MVKTCPCCTIHTNYGEGSDVASSVVFSYSNGYSSRPHVFPCTVHAYTYLTHNWTPFLGDERISTEEALNILNGTVKETEWW